MRFESPLAFLLLLLLPFLLEGRFSTWLKQIFLKNTKYKSINLDPAISFSTRTSFHDLPPSLRQRIRIPFLNLIKILSFLSLVLALARPQTLNFLTETETAGRDIILALDTSGSMDALDFSLDGERVSRLKALQVVVNEFIDKRQGDRIGLVVFGQDAFTQCPLTSDFSSLKTFISNLAVGMAGPATALGDGLGIALKRLRDINVKSKVIVLITDGKNNYGQLSPLEAADAANSLGIKVHTIGIGSNEPAPFPQKNMFGNIEYVYRKLDFDEETLKAIANRTGGYYFNAKNTDELKQVYDRIDVLELRQEEILEYVDYQEHFFFYLLNGFILFLVYEIIAATVFMRIP